MEDDPQAVFERQNSFINEMEQPLPRAFDAHTRYTVGFLLGEKVICPLASVPGICPLAFLAPSYCEW